MGTKKTITIPLEIHEDKQMDFLVALFKLKNGQDTSNTDLYNKLIDSIHFDFEPIQKLLENTTYDEKVDRKLKNTWHYFNAAKNQSQAYAAIFGDTYDHFRTTKFGENLKFSFYAFNIIKQFQGEENTLKIKVFKALLVNLLKSFMDAVGESISSTLQTAMSYNFNLFELNNGKYHQKIGLNNKIQIHFDDLKEVIEYEHFIDYKGEIYSFFDVLKLTEIDESDIAAHYIVQDSAVMKLELNERDEVVLITYDGARFIDNKLDLTHNTSTSYVTFPTGFLKENILSVNKETGEIIGECNFSATEESQLAIEANYVTEVKDTANIKQSTLSDSRIKDNLALMNIIEIAIQKYLTIPDGKYEQIEWIDRIIFDLLQILNCHYPNISHYSKCTIVGFILGQLNIIESEDKYDSSKRSTYRNYIKDYVAKRLKLSKTLIKLFSEEAKSGNINFQ